MSLSPAASSILALHLHAFLLTLLFAAMVSIPVELEHGDVNTTATMTLFTNSSSGPEESYLCFLCAGHECDPLLIHHCPIYWDECHLICWDDDKSAAVAVPAMATAPPAAPAAAAVTTSSSDHDDCYVMKFYSSGRYVIVEQRPCKGIGQCYLSCGGGELAADRKVVMGGTATATTATTVSAATTHGGTQQAINAPPSAASSGVFVPAAGGAHRRRR